MFSTKKSHTHTWVKELQTINERRVLTQYDYLSAYYTSPDGVYRPNPPQTTPKVTVEDSSTSVLYKCECGAFNTVILSGKP